MFFIGGLGMILAGRGDEKLFKWFKRVFYAALLWPAYIIIISLICFGHQCVKTWKN
jgi:hypothetical protein